MQCFLWMRPAQASQPANNIYPGNSLTPTSVCNPPWYISQPLAAAFSAPLPR